LLRVDLGNVVAEERSLRADPGEVAVEDGFLDVHLGKARVRKARS